MWFGFQQPFVGRSVAWRDKERLRRRLVFKSRSDDRLDFFWVVPVSIGPWLPLFIANWSAFCQLGFLFISVYFSSLFHWPLKDLVRRGKYITLQLHSIGNILIIFFIRLQRQLFYKLGVIFKRNGPNLTSVFVSFAEIFLITGSQPFLTGLFLTWIALRVFAQLMVEGQYGERTL